ncbi:hypothetical protein C8Q75DRAFT_734594 [Abortiporus biennis]|nr:hypothetical protein C8Q75DRAFT_734594 [Abortiporus biennis]
MEVVEKTEGAKSVTHHAYFSLLHLIKAMIRLIRIILHHTFVNMFKNKGGKVQASRFYNLDLKAVRRKEMRTVGDLVKKLYNTGKDSPLCVGYGLRTMTEEASTLLIRTLWGIQSRRIYYIWNTSLASVPINGTYECGIFNALHRRYIYQSSFNLGKGLLPLYYGDMNASIHHISTIISEPPEYISAQDLTA